MNEISSTSLPLCGEDCGRIFDVNALVLTELFDHARSYLCHWNYSMSENYSMSFRRLYGSRQSKIEADGKP